MMATQLFGTGGIAALLMLAAVSAVVDVALVLALLAAFASVAFVKNATRETDDLEGNSEAASANRRRSQRDLDTPPRRSDARPR
jgi:hypothetical protein